MKLYRICTENKNYQDVCQYLDKQFPSLIIEIVQKADVNIQHLAYWLRKHNAQKAVLVQIININSWLL